MQQKPREIDLHGIFAVDTISALNHVVLMILYNIFILTQWTHTLPYGNQVYQQFIHTGNLNETNIRLYQKLYEIFRYNRTDITPVNTYLMK